MDVEDLAEFHERLNNECYAPWHLDLVRVCGEKLFVVISYRRRDTGCVQLAKLAATLDALLSSPCDEAEESPRGEPERG